MNRTATVVPIIGALVKTEDILGPDRTWKTINEKQYRLIQTCFSKRAELSHFSPKELRSWIDTVAENLNAILQAEGFSIRLDKFEKDEFGVVSVLDVLVEWLFEGHETVIRTPAMGNYPGVKLENDNGENPFSVFESSRFPVRPIAAVRTKSADIVYMTVTDEPVEDFELLRKIELIESSMKPASRYDTLTFPMVDLDEQVNIGWLKDLFTRNQKGDPWKISQALQQTKFKMNQKGARVKSAVALGVMRSVSVAPPKRHLVIDQPFILWIKRPGMTLPIFAALLDEPVWKDPGNLEL